MTERVNLTSPTQVRALLEARGLRASQSLGQNFLVDANVRDIIVDASGVSERDVVVEIGPGLGVITELLVQRAGKVIAIEKDAGLYAWLKESIGAVANLELIHADALDVAADRMPAWGVTRLVSNLPYSVGSRILMDVFALPNPPASITVTVQLEVAERLRAPADHPERGLLSVWAQRRYDVRLIRTISPTCFAPRPKVVSALVGLERRAASGLSGGGAFFHDLTRACFGYRRKQMATILMRVAGDLGVNGQAAVKVLEGLQIDPRRRPETFDVDTWEQIAERLAWLRGQAPCVAAAGSGPV